MTRPRYQDIETVLPQLPKAMRRVALYALSNPVEVISRTASQLAVLLDTSDATVIRTAQALGFSGLADFKRAIAENLGGATPSKGFDRVLSDARADMRRAIDHALAFQAEAIHGLGDQNESLEAVVNVLHGRRRIALFGQGPTGHIVAYVAHLLRRHGREVLVLQASGRALADDVLQLRDGDGLLLLSYGQPSMEVRAVVAEGGRLGLPMVLLTSDGRNEMARKCDAVVTLPRGEVGGMAMHGATMVWLETLIVALAVASKDETRSALARLERIRQDMA